MMEPINNPQLDRIEQNVSAILDRLTRMEERQNNHGDQLGGHRVQLDDHSRRLRQLESDLAVIRAQANGQVTLFNGRWAAIGSVVLVLVGVVGSVIGQYLIAYWSL